MLCNVVAGPLTYRSSRTLPPSPQGLALLGVSHSPARCREGTWPPARSRWTAWVAPVTRKIYVLWGALEGCRGLHVALGPQALG